MSVEKKLSCIYCRGRLVREAERLCCTSCGREFFFKNDIAEMVDKRRASEADLLIKRFYDEFPYDIDAGQVYEKLSPFSKKVFSSVKPGDRVVDVGCGVGRNIRRFMELGCSVIGVDQSISSLRRIRRIDSEIELVNASVFNLPFNDEVFDVVTSVGVLHHTGDARRAFVELARILKPGGTLYLSIYRKYGTYYFIYKSVGCVFRSLTMLRPIGLYFFYLFDKFLLKRGRSFRQSEAFFADYFLVPVASFHTEREVCEWVKKEAMKCNVYKRHHPDMVSVIVTKT